MTTQYFSDRENGPRPRTEEVIGLVVWKGIAATVQTLVDDGSFGLTFPAVCNDGADVFGTHVTNWQSVLMAEHPAIEWPFHLDAAPDTLAILDLIQFAHDNIGKPIKGSHHEFFSHFHLTFDRDAGRAEFRQKISRLFARNGLAYELREDGMIVRLAPTVLQEMLQAATFQTGDGTLDGMLESARTKFLNPNPQVRRESLEKLWDAWERLKTIGEGNDKKSQVNKILDQAATEPNFRRVLETEAKALTDVGNNFLIRHSETNRTAIGPDQHVDYLFHRLFSLVWMILKSRGTQN
jgi:hypothetical protein